MQVLAALFVVVPFCYLSGSFTINPVTEAASQARHLQLLSGCPSFIYWAGFYVSMPPCSPAHFAQQTSSHACVLRITMESARADRSNLASSMRKSRV